MDERKKMNQGEKTGKERTSCGLDAGQIRQGLSPFWQGLAVQVHEVVTSTNDLAKKEAREGRPVLVAACQQTAGRGRRGRSFYSPAGTGHYLSLAFPWEEEVPPTLLTPLAALAAAEVLEDLVEAPIGIKWVNDLYLGGKKIAGILTEAVTRLPKEAGVFLVLGLGINLTPPPQGFPQELAGRAGSLTQGERALDKNRLVLQICHRLGDWIQSLPDRGFLEGYRARSFILGQKVSLDTGEVIVPLAISDQGGLLYMKEGQLEELDSGQVSLVDFPL